MRVKKLLLAVIEASRTSSPKKNKDRLLRLLGKHGRLLEDSIILLPENWYSREPVEEQEYMSLLDDLYASTGYTIFPGLSYVRVGGSVRSRGYAIIDGRIELVCEKTFPSKAVGEREHIKGGEVSRVLEVYDARVGCVACVDIFYPEITRKLVVKGANVIYNPAAIPADRLGLWWSVLRARAAENIVFALGVNSIGVVYPDGRITGGGSRVYSPGGILITPRVEDGLLLYEIDLEEIKRVRARWAFREDLETRLSKHYV